MLRDDYGMEWMRPDERDEVMARWGERLSFFFSLVIIITLVPSSKAFDGVDLPLSERQEQLALSNQLLSQ